MPPNNIIRVDTNHPAPQIINQAADILNQGGLVIFPASCLYGVAANALSAPAVEKVFQLKHRPHSNPILVLIKSVDQLSGLVSSVPAQAQTLMDRFWPGGLTLVFDAAPHLCPKLTAGSGKIGIRQPGHPVAQALVNRVDFPVTGTSANLSGQPGCTQIKDLDATIIQNADLILDVGPVFGGSGSTVVDVTKDSPIILRQGTVSVSEISASLALFT